jgi:hypothetical protein
MTYTQISILAVLIAVTLDLFVIKTVLLKRAAFWWLTSRNIVMYDPDVITGIRFFSAPAEDVLFGFALILSVQSLWVNLGKSARSNRS